MVNTAIQTYHNPTALHLGKGANALIGEKIKAKGVDNVVMLI
ncbi:hypothetical protein KIPB_016106, partial [Kipferlia bialata]|eukprot:g16106.t1